jgi:predicted metal-dependent enzyme (double-stranded beta helix superfamily)
VLEVTGLHAFVRDLDALVAQYQAAYAILVQRAKPLLERLLTGMTAPDATDDLLSTNGRVRRLVHRHPTGAYTIWAMMFLPGRTTPVHDHSTWGLVGVWRGEEHEERFERVDHHAYADHAELRPLGTAVNTAGCVTVLVPPNHDIHRIANPTSEPALSIHIYGRSIAGKTQRVYDPATGRVLTRDGDPLGTALAWRVQSAGPDLKTLLGTPNSDDRQSVAELRRRLVDAATQSSAET